MGPAEVLLDAGWVQAHRDDPAMARAAAREDGIKPAHRLLLCRCRHSRDDHRHYRAGSDCALCDCPRWSPWNPVSRLARRLGR